jgi:hypothetical protein
MYSVYAGWCAAPITYGLLRQIQRKNQTQGRKGAEFQEFFAS